MKKKLAIITTHPIQYNAPLFQLLVQRGNIQIHVFYTWGNDVLQKKFDPGFNRSVEWDIPLLNDYEFSFVNNISSEKGSHHYNGIINPDLIDIINAWTPDAILIYGWNFKSHLSVMRYFKNKIPVLFRGDSTLVDKRSFVKKVIRKLYLSSVFRNIDYALYAGTANMAYFKNGGLNASQLVFMPHAIDNNRFTSSLSTLGEAHSWRQRLGISENTTVFLFAGKLENKKNPQLLVEAFTKTSLVNACLIIAGNGPLEQDLKESFDNFGNVKFIDFQNQSLMPGLYQACDVFVLPSQGPGETWGLAVNEAMAGGKAIVVSNICGCATDLVINQINGFVFTNNDLKGLTDILRYLSSDRHISKRMGKASANLIQEFNFIKQAEVIENLMAL